MIYTFKNLDSRDQRILKYLEPFYDYSYEPGQNLRTVHRRVENEIHYQELRLYQLDQLRQGFICTDINEAKQLTRFLSGDNTHFNKEYPWLDKYVEEHPAKFHLTAIAIPIGEFIEEYSHDFKTLSLVNFTEVFK
ncbi:MAG: hypothetical protein WD491_05535 [Balneolales bacterium]